MAARIRTVCCIHSNLAPAFTRLGVKVLCLDPPPGTASLPELLAGLPQPPDCVIHQEHLGRRVVLTDIEAAPCPTIFWARDPHLNFFWQRHYARLFSAVASTQPPAPFLEAGAARADWVTWHGIVRPFVPFANRPNALVFVGRLTPSRQRRQCFAEHLARRGLILRQDAFGPDLDAAYADARLAPNECIAGEVNMRLFEAASRGCLPVSERTPAEVAELFVPKREALYYDDVLELDDHLRFAAARPALAEKMALAAHAAVAARHLPEHRAAGLLALAENAGTGARGPEAAAALALTLFSLRRSGQLALPRSQVWERLAAAPPTPEILAASIQVALSAGDREAVLAMAAQCLARPELAADVRCAAACCLAACRLDDTRAAKMAWLGFMAGSAKKRTVNPAGAHDYLLFFAAALEAAGHLAAPGMPFDPQVHLPGNAAECLVAAKILRPDCLETDRRLNAILRRLPGTQIERIGLLSHRSLHRPDDWTTGLELGLANLRAFRREAGLGEILLAAATAERLGQADRFARRLANADPEGRLRAALAETGASPRTPSPGG